MKQDLGYALTTNMWHLIKNGNYLKYRNRASPVWGKELKLKLRILIPQTHDEWTHIDELLLLLLSHVSQAVVATRQLPLQARQRRHDHALHLAALRARARRGQAQPADAAAGAHAGRQHVLLVKHPVGDLAADKEN